jgi:hypothetical protein
MLSYALIISVLVPLVRSEGIGGCVAPTRLTWVGNMNNLRSVEVMGSFSKWQPVSMFRDAVSTALPAGEYFLYIFSACV